MRILLIWALLLPSLASASQGANPLFAKTHMLPSPFTLPAGRLIIGTEVALGVTDFLQIGTSLISDIYQVYNVNAKLSLVDLEPFALALTGHYQTFNYRNLDSANPDISVSSYGPGMVASYQVIPNLSHSVGGRLSFSDVTQNLPGTRITGYVRGAEAETDLSWAHGPSKNPTALVLSAGVSRDFTYELTGFGLSYHVQGLHFGFHYYPDADRYKFYPIIVGGTALSF
jgi:hypothetical protein